MAKTQRSRRLRSVWVILLLVSFPVAIGYPFVDAYVFKHVSFETAVPFEFTAGLLTTSSILFGFTSLILVSKEWIEREIWAVIVPPLALIIFAGVSISNLALGVENLVRALLLSSATFNASVVSTGLMVGYVVQKLSQRPKT